MVDDEKLLVIAAHVKWINGEHLSRADVERIISTFEARPITVDAVDAQVVAALQVRLRSILAKQFGLVPQ